MDGSAQRIPIKVEIEDAVAQGITKKPKRRLRHTNLFFTINTNQPYNTTDNELKGRASRKFTAVVRELLSGEKIKEYVKFVNKCKEHFWDPQYVKEAEIHTKSEFGPEKSMLHLHGLISIRHYSCIRVDFELLKERLQEKLGLDGLHIRWQLFFDTKGKIEDYIEKTKFSMEY